MSVLTHSFVSAVADDATQKAAGAICPSHWNDDHTFAGGSNNLGLVRDTGATYGASWATTSLTIGDASAGAVLNLNANAASDPKVSWQLAGVEKGSILWDHVNSLLSLRTGGTNAITIDTNQAITGQNQPHTWVYSSASTIYTLSSAVSQVVAFDSELFDVGNCHAPTPNPSRLTAPSAGIYLVIGRASFGVSTSGLRSINLLKNGTTFTVMQNQSGSSTNNTVLLVQGIVSLAVGDYVELSVYQASGGNLALNGGDAISTTALMWVKLW